MLLFMRSLEVHVFETDNDLDNAVKAGVVLPEQIAITACADCGESVCYTDDDFCPFALIIDENDQDWILCEDCASPILDYVDKSFPPLVRSSFPEDLSDYDLF
jgi:hypothetical protein